MGDGNKGSERHRIYSIQLVYMLCFEMDELDSKMNEINRRTARRWETYPIKCRKTGVSGWGAVIEKRRIINGQESADDGGAGEEN